MNCKKTLNDFILILLKKQIVAILLSGNVNDSFMHSNILLNFVHFYKTKICNKGFIMII